jgi:hypothetical protein
LRDDDPHQGNALPTLHDAAVRQRAILRPA